jgi:type IV secretory pathway TraG/TraD family ATPase VirD4
MEIGIKKERRLWYVIDELPSLGKLPVLTQLMAEGRKYGACILAGLQSLNQLYSNYGHYDGSTIFGQFGTTFFFRNSEPSIAKVVSSMCGMETVVRQQKNTSFGANEFRDGVSYNEHQQKNSYKKVPIIENVCFNKMDNRPKYKGFKSYYHFILNCPVIHLLCHGLRSLQIN